MSEVHPWAKLIGSREDDPQWPESLREVIQNFCSRPKMYFRDGRFSEFAYLVDGFVMGRGGRTADEMTAFRKWLAARAYKADGTARNLAWVCYIEQLYPDDALAFAEFPKLYDMFQSETNSAAA